MSTKSQHDRRREDLIGYPAPFCELLANKNLHIINSIYNGVNKVSRKEGLKSICRVSSAGEVASHEVVKEFVSILLIDIVT